MISKIFHLADIHIRNYKRHSEYNEVFSNLYKELERRADKDSVIFLAGDIVHGKTDMSPELIVMTINFLTSLSEICPVIIIAGNHDANLKNENRLDAIKPLVDYMDNPNIHYFRESGVYEFGGVDWSVFSVFGDKDDWVMADDINSGRPKIAVHHGAVSTAVTHVGHEIKNDHLTPSIFKGFDLSLLGDIHKFQFLDSDQTVCYPGTVIQQNYGEHFERGFVEWDLKSKTHEFVRVHNDIAYYTFNVEDGKIVNDREEVKKLPNKLRMRYYSKGTSEERNKAILKVLKDKYDVLECIEENDATGDVESNSETILGDVRDVEYQNELISQIMKMKYSESKIDVNALWNINRMMNTDIDISDSTVRNVIWYPISFKFSNMFSYGEDNHIDFTQMKDLQGIFAPNASGKSSLLDAIVYCLFDKCSRTYKGSEVMNNRSDTFECEFSFKMSEYVYTIRREGKRSSNGSVRVEADFSRTKDGGDPENLNGLDRYKTNKIIRDFIGSYDDFLLTSFSSQNDNTNFIYKTQGERQDLLNSFLGINVFDSLSKRAKEDLKEHKSNVKVYSELASEIDVDEITEERRGIESEVKDAQVKLKSEKKKLEGKREELLTLQGSLGDTKEVRDIEEIEADIVRYESNVDRYEKDLADVEDDIKHFTSEQVAFAPKSKKFDQDVYDGLSEEINDYESKLSNVTNKISLLERDLSHLKSKADRLETHEYDPDCKYCVQNEFVIDAQQAKDKIPEVESEIEAKGESKEKFTSELEEKQAEFKVQQEYKKAHDEIEKLDEKIEEANSKVANLKEMISEAKDRIGLLIKEGEECEKYKKESAERKRIKENMEMVKDDIKQHEGVVERLTSNIGGFKNSISRIDGKLEENEKHVDKLKKEKKLRDAYQLYVDIMGKKGVPFMLIKRVLPVIQSGVNDILSNVVDFTVEFYTEGGKNILCDIQYGDGKVWAVELTSGMESFMISLATRAALINISSLPRPNFIAIDEGFGVLDSDNLPSIDTFFAQLNTQFEFILCISHLEDMKDLADSLISIHKDSDGFSHVNV